MQARGANGIRRSPKLRVTKCFIHRFIDGLIPFRTITGQIP